MARGMEEEGQDLDAEGKALREQLRVQKRNKRLQPAETSRRLPSLPGDALHGAREAFQRSSSCAALGSMPAQLQPHRPGLAEWKVHDESWERFRDEPPEPLYVEAVPWPPNIDDTLDFY